MEPISIDRIRIRKYVFVFGLTIFSLLMLMLVLGTGAQAADIYVDDDNMAGPWLGTMANPYQNITSAVGNATGGDTIHVWEGDYNENVVVNKTLSLIGNGTGNTTIIGTGTGDVVYVNASWVNVTGFTVNNSGSNPGDAGIELDNVQNCNIYDNNVSGNNHGIHLDSSDNAAITANTIWNNGRGLVLASSVNCVVDNNTFTGNGIVIEGDSQAALSTWNTHTIDATNTANGRPIYYYKDATGVTVPGDAAQVLLANCTGFEISGLNLSGADVGIELGASTYVNITLSAIRYNNVMGIYLNYSTSISIIRNNVSNNGYGLYLDDATLVTIENNSVSTNSLYGAYITGSSGSNRIFHNDFMGNNGGGVQAYDDAGANFWNDTYPSGGNFWSDLTSPDNKQGPAQDQKGGDGMVDIPYYLDGGADANDSYPLTTPIGPLGYGEIIISNYDDGDYVHGTILVSVVINAYGVTGIMFYVDGVPTYFSSKSSYQRFILDTTTLTEDAQVLITAEAYISDSPSISASVTLIVNNVVDTGDYIEVSTIDGVYPPGQTVSVITATKFPPPFETLNLRVSYVDPDGTLFSISRNNQPYAARYKVGVGTYSDAALGTYNVTVWAYGRINGELVWEATNTTSFTVVGASMYEQIMNINATVNDINANVTWLNLSMIQLQADMDYMNATIPMLVNNLSGQLDSVNASISNRLDALNSTFLVELAKVNLTLYNEIQALLTSVTADIAGMNASLAAQLTSVEGNIIADNTAMRTWLEAVLDELSANLTEANQTIHADLADLEALTTAQYNALDADLDVIMAMLVSMEGNLSAQHDALNASIALQTVLLNDQHNLTREQILAALNDTHTLLQSVDANLTAHDGDIKALLASLSALVQSENELTRQQLIENVTTILVEIEAVDQDVLLHDADVKAGLNTLSSLVSTLHQQTLSEINSLLAGIANNLSAHDASVAGRINDVRADVAGFQTTVDARLAAIDDLLANLTKLDDILADLQALDQSLEAAETELRADIAETGKAEGAKMDSQTVLLVLILVLVAISMLMSLMGRKKQGAEQHGQQREEAHADMEPEPEEEEDLDEDLADGEDG